MNQEPEEKLEDMQDAVAVIGLSGRFPGALSADALWRNLCDGVESIRFFSADELRGAGVDPAVLADPAEVGAQGSLDGVELFDAPFFGFTPREAEWTDPQHRLLLECAWEALEAAGYARAEQPGPVGVFVGSGVSHYYDGAPRSGEAALGGHADFLATRIAYKLNLRGPAFTVQTACSTSLVAVHLAVKSLLDGECDMVLAGGVSIRLPQVGTYLYQEGGIFSPDGHCRPFDAQAQGTVGGNGAGIVLLKRLEDALADGDPVRAVIRGSAINNDGAGKIGFTAPSVDGQARAVAEALALARVDAGSISYVEAHGTATPLGDPIEIAALTQAFRRTTETTERKNFCAIGSLKGNLGHLDAAAGVAGLIKTVLALEHRMLPPSLHFTAPNPRIDFASSPFFVNDRLRPWDSAGPRRAGVSSFGMGGTNAHVVLEEAPAVVPEISEPGTPQLLVLSAKTDTALAAAARRLADHLAAHPDLSLGDVAWTLQAGRRAFEHRLAVVAGDLIEAGDLLVKAAEKAPARPAPGQEPPVVFLFPGQGSQHVGMARDLYESVPVFRATLDRCCDLLRGPLGFDLREVLFPDPGHEEEAERRLGRTAVIQPALFAVEYALARTWMAWGVQPAAMLGHSIGEIVAACVAGVFSLEDALALVAARGALVESLPGGAMLAVFLPEADVLDLLGPDLSLAAVNAPERSVVSGPEAAIAALEADLAARAVPCRRLRNSHALHSAVLDPILDRFAARVRAVERRAPALPFLSNVTGTWITAEQATDPDYWVRHLRQTVRFAAAVRELGSDPERIYLEVGPGTSLGALLKQNLKRPAAVVVSSLRPPKEDLDDRSVLLRAARDLWRAGVPLVWGGLHGEESRRRVVLPTYPFERKAYWLRAEPAVVAAAPIPAPVPAPAPPDAFEELVAQQLAVLARQLEVLAEA